MKRFLCIFFFLLYTLPMFAADTPTPTVTPTATWTPVCNTHPCNTSVTAAATDTHALGSFEGRKYLIVVNIADEQLFLAMDASAVLNEGIVLSAAGNPGDRWECPYPCQFFGYINVISTSGSKKMVITEW